MFERVYQQKLVVTSQHSIKFFYELNRQRSATSSNMSNNGLSKILGFLGLDKTGNNEPGTQENYSSLYSEKLRDALHQPAGAEKASALRLLLEEIEKQNTNSVEESPEQKVDRYSSAGVAYSELQQHEEALSYHDKAIEIANTIPALYYNRANTYNKLGEYQKAIIDYKRAIALDPENADYHCNLGYTYDDLGMYEEAIENYNKAIDINPYNTINLSCRAAAYVNLKEYDKAIADYNQAVELDPFDPQLFFNRGLTLANRGEIKEALKDFEECINIDPENQFGQKGMAQMAIQQLSNIGHQ